MRPQNQASGYGRKFILWLGESITHLVIFEAGALVLFMLGWWMTFTLPVIATRGAIEAARTEISVATDEYNKAQDRFNREAPWYKPGRGYVDSLPSSLSESVTNINTAAATWDKAYNMNRNPDEKVRVATQAKLEAQESRAASKTVTTQLDAINKERSDALIILVALSEKVTVAGNTVLTANTRFENEAGQYLPKYTGPIADVLSAGLAKVQEGQQYLYQAKELLPPNETKGQGDPRAAQSAISASESAIQQGTTLAASVTTALDYQAEAKANSRIRTQEANEAYHGENGAKSYVDGIAASTGYWLKASYVSLSEALAALESAQSLLNMPEPLDHPAAYESAKTSLARSQQANHQASAEVAVAKAANEAIALIDQRVSEVQRHIGVAQDAEGTLRSYHAGDTWSSVASHLSTASSHVATALEHQSRARELVALSVQEFSQGKVEADAGLARLADADNLASAVESKRNELESYRSNWPGCESTAANHIQSASGNISSYGSYDSGAVSRYNNAKSGLDTARGEAGSGHYQQACATATNAGNQAAQAGRDAKQAYDDEMDRQRRAREEAERAAERARQAAADAARRASESSSSSGSGGYGGYDSGGSSCCDSGGYNSGGSDSDYGGGGSDSDY